MLKLPLNSVPSANDDKFNHSTELLNIELKNAHLYGLLLWLKKESLTHLSKSDAVLQKLANCLQYR